MRVPELQPEEAGTRTLVCEECGIENLREALDWRAYLTDDGQAVMFCPECAAREFDEE